MSKKYKEFEVEEQSEIELIITALQYAIERLAVIEDKLNVYEKDAEKRTVEHWLKLDGP